MTERTVRIFISSPGDYREDRVIAGHLPEHVTAAEVAADSARAIA